MKKVYKPISCTVIAALLFSLFSIFPSYASARYNPIIILKFDDLCNDNVENFQKCFDILQSYDIDSAGFGVIGKHLEDSKVTGELISGIMRWNRDGIEIWHHGYSHEEGEYNASSYESQKESFGKTCDLLKEKTGITIKSFGSPFNNADETTVKVINENFPEIKCLMLVADPLEEASMTNIKVRANIESQTGVVSYDGFLQNYEKQKRASAVILQGHAGMWKDADREEFKKILEFLKEKNATFMTPSQYADYEAQKMLEPDEEKIIEVTVNGKYVEFDDVAPILLNGRTMVPFRKIFDVLGAKVDWDGENAVATAIKGDKIIKISEDSTAYINSEPVLLDVAATIIDDRFFVPLRFVSEALDQIVYWDEANSTVVITPKTERTAPLPEGAIEIKDCTFSSYFEDELGYMSYDGDIETLWSCEGKAQWICYDLGKESSVSKASILWNKADQRKARFKIEISGDNENFDTLFDGEACGTTTTFEDYEISGSGRYLRIYCMGNSDSNWNAIKEIVIYK